MAYDKLLYAGEDAQADEIHSAEWWESRTPEELRAIIDLGFAGGVAFNGAIAESERRAGQEMSRLREGAIAEVRERRKLTVYLALAVVIAAVVGVLSAEKWLFS